MKRHPTEKDWEQYNHAGNLNNQKKYREAIKILEVLVKEVNCSSFNSRLGLCYERIQDLNKAEQIHLSNMEFQYQCYAKAQKSGDPLALRKAKASLEIDITIYGRFLTQTEGAGIALPFYEEKAAEFPEFKHLQLGLSICLIEHPNINEEMINRAITHAYNALNIDPEFDSAYSQIGHCFNLKAKRITNPNMQKKYREQASQYFEKAIEINPARLDRHAIIHPDQKVDSLETEEEIKIVTAPAFDNVNLASQFYSGNNFRLIIASEKFVNSPLFLEVKSLLDNIDETHKGSILTPYLMRDFDDIKKITQKGDFEGANKELENLKTKLMFKGKDAPISVINPIQDLDMEAIEAAKKISEAAQKETEGVGEEHSAVAKKKKSGTRKQRNKQKKTRVATKIKQPALPEIQNNRVKTSLCKFGLFCTGAAVVAMTAVIASYQGFGCNK